MKRAFTNGFLTIEFPVNRGRPLWKLLLDSVRLFFTHLPYLAGLTLVVFLPAKAAIHLVCALFDVPPGGILMYVLLDASDLVLGAAVVPSVVYALLFALRGRPLPPFSDALRWGRRQWPRTLGNRILVTVTIMLWSLLLVVPGILKMLELALVDPVIAIEADRERAPLERSRALSRGKRWRILFALLPVMLFETVGSYLVLKACGPGEHSRPLMAVVDSLLSVGGQWATVVGLLLYLDLTPSLATPQK